MGHISAWIMDIVAPAILLIVLIWLVLRRRSDSNDTPNPVTKVGTREVYQEEETRRREGTDEL
jgi:hypothetical protein